MSAPSTEAFNAGIFREHLEDVGFLWSQRRNWSYNPEIPWMQLADLETRIEAHLDGLVVGGEAAASVCIDTMTAQDVETVFAGAAYACATLRGPVLAAALGHARGGDPAVAGAVRDALVLYLPGDWNAFLARAVDRSSEPLRSALADVAGRHRIALDASMFGGESESFGAAVLYDAGRRLRCLAAAAFDPSRVMQADPKVRYSAYLASVCHDVRAGVRFVADSAAVDPIAHLVLATCCGADGARVLCSHVEAAGPSAQAVLGLGLLGDGAGLPILVRALSDPLLAGAASEALQLLTGAGLLEETFVPEPAREDEMTETELARLRADGTVPARGDGKPFGSTLTRPCRDPDRWERWIAQSGRQFEAGRRYRLGELLTPALAVGALRRRSVNPRLRSILCDEFVVRYGVDLGLETEMLVAEQLRALERMAGWAASQEQAIEPGAFTLAGRPIR